VVKPEQSFGKEFFGGGQYLPTNSPTASLPHRRIVGAGIHSGTGGRVAAAASVDLPPDEWELEGPHRMQIYAQPLPKKKLGEFATNVRSDGPDRWIVEPVFLQLDLEDDSVLHLYSAIFDSEFTEAQASPLSYR
jgi:hypothetical protein